MSLLTVGSVAFDDIETPFGKSNRIIGGAATFISLSASYFIDDVRLVAVVGGDFPKDKIELFKQKGIRTEGLQVKENEKSFYWHGRYHNDMNSRDTITTELNVFENFDPVIPDSYQPADYLMLGNILPSLQMKVLERLEKRPKLIVMDTMNLWIDIAKEELLKVIAKVDVLSINDEEARQLTGEHSLVKAARAIMATGPAFLIIKKGEHGALLFNKDQVFFAPALPLEEVFDPTGAGDTFAGGFIGYIAKTGDSSFENMKKAVIHGSAMASFCVEKFGTQRLENLTPADMQHRLEEFINLSRMESLL